MINCHQSVITCPINLPKCHRLSKSQWKTTVIDTKWCCHGTTQLLGTCRTVSMETSKNSNTTEMCYPCLHITRKKCQIAHFPQFSCQVKNYATTLVENEEKTWNLITNLGATLWKLPKNYNFGPWIFGYLMRTARCQWSKIHRAVVVPFGKCVTILHILAVNQD